MATNSPPYFDYQIHQMQLSDGIQLAWTDEGRGPLTLVFVHGMASNLNAWRKNILVLREQYRCISLDLPNFGGSSRGTHSFTMPFLSGILQEFVQRIDAEEVVLVGHSMGGQVTLHTLVHHPELAVAAILVAPAGIEQFSDTDVQWLEQAYRLDNLLSLQPEQVVQNYRSNFFRYPDDAHFMLEDMNNLAANGEYPLYCETIRKCVLGMVSDPVRKHFPEIEHPILVLFGEDDALIPHPRLHLHQTPHDIIPSGVNALPKSKLEFIASCGHFLQWEKSSQFNRAAIDFLTSRLVNPDQTQENSPGNA